MNSHNSIIMYRTKDGQTKIEARFEQETVWFTQTQMADFFQQDREIINKHIQAILTEGELNREQVCNYFPQPNANGLAAKIPKIKHYNLDMLLAIAYRIPSHRGMHFRQWATELIKTFLINGFVIHDELRLQTENYFDQLLSRIEQIRSSSNIFGQKMEDLFATSIDFDSQTEQYDSFVKILDGKTHWPSKKQAIMENEIDPNPTNPLERKIWERMTNALLEIAEIQALNRVPMYMNDWIKQFHLFFCMNVQEILEFAHTTRHQEALEKARAEYARFYKIWQNEVIRKQGNIRYQLETWLQNVKDQGYD